MWLNLLPQKICGQLFTCNLIGFGLVFSCADTPSCAVDAVLLFLFCFLMLAIALPEFSDLEWQRKFPIMWRASRKRCGGAGHFLCCGCFVPTWWQIAVLSLIDQRLQFFFSYACEEVQATPTAADWNDIWFGPVYSKWGVFYSARAFKQIIIIIIILGSIIVLVSM